MTEPETSGFANNARAALLKFSGEKLKFADKKNQFIKCMVPLQMSKTAFPPVARARPKDTVTLSSSSSSST
jgi:hypothetical protein